MTFGPTLRPQYDVMAQCVIMGICGLLFVLPNVILAVLGLYTG
jgi:hypothetical protein